MKLFGFDHSQTLQGNSLQTIDALTLKQWLDQQSAVRVDVREQYEYASGHIPGATLIPLSSFDPGTIPQSPNYWYRPTARSDRM